MLPIRNAMREPGQFWGLFQLSFGFVVSLQLLFGLAGYVGYGDNVKQVVLLNLPRHHRLVLAAKLAYIIGLVCGFSARNEKKRRNSKRICCASRRCVSVVSLHYMG